MKLTHFLSAVAMVAALFGATSTTAQTFPSKPIKIIVPFAVGTALDIVARSVADGMAEDLGVSVVVDNRLGASGVLGTDAVVKAPADGHTVLFTSPAHYLNTSLYKKLPYDADKDFRAVTKISNAQLVLLVPKNSSINSVKDLIAEAKAKPGVLTYSSAGSGSTTQLCSALFNAMAGTDITHIPYKSGGQALTDLIGGQVSTTFVAVASAMSQVKAGSVKALGVSGLVRSRSMPDVPTISESGVTGYELVSWGGALVRAGTPDAIVARLNAAMVKVASKPEFQARLQGLGVEPDLMPTEVFAARIVKEIPHWAKVAQNAGVTPE
jgi:tripartite-type tricarboxylate transporter receptor subunit TctC